MRLYELLDKKDHSLLREYKVFKIFFFKIVFPTNNYITRSHNDYINKYSEYCIRGFNESIIENRSDQLSSVIMGINEESGEITSLIRKSIYHGKKLDKSKLKSEMGDLLWYYMVLLKLFNFTLMDIIKYNVLKLNERYPKGRNVIYQPRPEEKFDDLDKISSNTDINEIL
jgi:NTP pyrophosphatase (non-canonical NTP hydrolase)